MPFGYVPIRHDAGDAGVAGARPASPMPFGYVPIRHRMNHVLSIFDRLIESPMPFGYVPIRHRSGPRLDHVRQRVSPMPFGYVPIRHRA